MPRWFIEFARPGEGFARIGSDEGFDDFERASEFFRYQVKGSAWRGTVQLVDENGVRIEAVTSKKETP